MHIEVQGGAEGLDEGHRAAPAGGHPYCPRALAVPPEHRPEEHRQHLAAQPRPTCQPEPERHGQGQDPLADRHLWKHPVHQVRRGLGHPAPTTRRAEPAALAGERHHVRPVAGVTPEQREAVGRDPAGQVREQLALHVGGHRAVVLSCLFEEGREVLLQGLVQQVGRPRARGVAGGGAGRRVHEHVGAASNLRTGQRPAFPHSGVGPAHTSDSGWRSSLKAFCG
jgi:hypothetical protein